MINYKLSENTPILKSGNYTNPWQNCKALFLHADLEAEWDSMIRFCTARSFFHVCFLWLTQWCFKVPNDKVCKNESKEFMRLSTISVARSTHLFRGWMNKQRIASCCASLRQDQGFWMLLVNHAATRPEASWGHNLPCLHNIIQNSNYQVLNWFPAFICTHLVLFCKDSMFKFGELNPGQLRDLWHFCHYPWCLARCFLNKL